MTLPFGVYWPQFPDGKLVAASDKELTAEQKAILRREYPGVMFLNKPLQYTGDGFGVFSKITDWSLHQ